MSIPVSEFEALCAARDRLASVERNIEEHAAISPTLAAWLLEEPF